MASSISFKPPRHRDRRHPRRRLAYVAAVAIMGLAAETVLLHLTQLSQPTPLDPMPTCPVLPRPPMSLLPPGGALQRPSLPPSLPLHRCRLVISVYGHWGLPSFSLSPGPPSAAELHAAILALSQEPGACV